MEEKHAKTKKLQKKKLKKKKNKSPEGKVAWDIRSKRSVLLLLFVFSSFFLVFVKETEYGRCWLTGVLTGILRA